MSARVSALYPQKVKFNTRLLPRMQLELTGLPSTPNCTDMNLENDGASSIVFFAERS